MFDLIGVNQPEYSTLPLWAPSPGTVISCGVRQWIVQDVRAAADYSYVVLDLASVFGCERQQVVMTADGLSPIH
jgi:hypothetical protein